jgi:ABC-2 type transport system permease protein
MATDTQTPSRASADRRQVWAGQARAFAERYARELFRNKVVLFWSVAFPVAFYLLTITVFIDTGAVPDTVVPYQKAGVAVSYGMFGAIVASLNSFGQQLAADFEADRYMQYRSLPLAPSADLAGRAVAGLALSVVAFVAVLVVAVPTGAAFSLRSAASVPVVVLAVLTFAVLWMMLAVVVATLVRDARYASVVTISIALGAYFLTGYNGTDPGAFAGPDWLLNWLPFTLATRLVSHNIVVFPDTGVLGSGSLLSVPSLSFGVGLLAATALAAVAVGLLVMRHAVYGEVRP